MEQKHDMRFFSNRKFYCYRDLTFSSQYYYNIGSDTDISKSCVIAGALMNGFIINEESHSDLRSFQQGCLMPMKPLWSNKYNNKEKLKMASP